MRAAEDNAILQAGMPEECHFIIDLSNELLWLE
jgi:hypothetical protein